jgi:PHD/YefM family antitoxin component YafN of YafNO toxin-antitoxin module
MKSYTASYFKTHFGAVLDRAGVEPIRIERRGRDSTIIIPESEYRDIRNQALAAGKQPNAALERLRALALGPEAKFKPLKADFRATAILNKHR